MTNFQLTAYSDGSFLRSSVNRGAHSSVSGTPAGHLVSSVTLTSCVHLAIQLNLGDNIFLTLLNFCCFFRDLVEQITLSQWKNWRRPIQTTKVSHFLMKVTRIQLERWWQKSSEYILLFISSTYSTLRMELLSHDTKILTSELLMPIHMYETVNLSCGYCYLP